MYYFLFVSLFSFVTCSYNVSGYIDVAIVEKTPPGGFTKIPIDRDGTIPLSTIQAQFGAAVTGLKYKNKGMEGWTGIRLGDGVLSQPKGGWGSRLYVVVVIPAGTY